MKRVENGEEKKKKKRNIVKGEVENLKWKEEKMENEERTFFHFSKPLKFVLGLPKWKFSTVKKHFTPGKKIRKNDFAPSEKFSCYAPAGVNIHVLFQANLTQYPDLQHCIHKAQQNSNDIPCGYRKMMYIQY